MRLQDAKRFTLILFADETTGRGGREQQQQPDDDADDGESSEWAGRRHGFAAEGKARVHAALPSTAVESEELGDSPMMASIEISSARRLIPGFAAVSLLAFLL